MRLALVLLLVCTAASAAWCPRLMRRVNGLGFALGIGDVVTLESPGEKRPPKATFLGLGKLPDREEPFYLFYDHGKDGLVAIEKDALDPKSILQTGDGGIQELLTIRRQTKPDCAVHAACNPIRYFDQMGFQLSDRAKELLENHGAPLFEAIAETPVNAAVHEKIAEGDWWARLWVPGQYYYRDKFYKEQLGMRYTRAHFPTELWNHVRTGNLAVLDLHAKTGPSQKVEIRREGEVESVEVPALEPLDKGKSNERTGHSVLAIGGVRTGILGWSGKVLVLDSNKGTFALWDYAKIQDSFEGGTLLHAPPRK